MELLGISLGESVGACGTDDFRSVWNLKMLSRSAHEGAVMQAFAEILNNRFGSSVLSNRRYDYIAYMRPDASVIDRPAVKFCSQLEGVLLSMASHYHSENSGGFEIVALWPKAVARFATGKAAASDAEYHESAILNDAKFSSSRVSAAYWVREAAQRELVTSH